jgi:hypothetical protein
LCEIVVCDVDESCCDISWDEGCAALASERCACAGGYGPCCVANTTPYCEDSLCTSVVCGSDPFCCGDGGGYWDADCAAHAEIACSVCD